MGCINNQAWMAQAHIEADAYYNVAVYYYKQQREQFLQQITGIANEVQLSLWQGKFLQQFNEQATDLSGTPLENTEAFKTGVINKVEELAAQFLTTGNSSKYREIIESSTGKTKKDNENYLRNYNNRIKDRFNKCIESNQVLKSQLAQIYKDAFSVKGMTSSSMSGMLSLFRRSMIAQVANGEFMTQSLLSDASIQGYIKLFKGYNAEKISEKAGIELLKQLGTKWTAKQVGSSGGVVDVGFIKKNELNNLEQILQTIENSTGSLPVSTTGYVVEPLAAYGLQSKSWYMPSDVLQPGVDKKQFYTLGHRAELLNSLGINSQSKASWWHYNIVLVAKNLTKAIGAANVLYVTGGNKYIWTADLISEFREYNYYLSFYYRREKGKFFYPPTSEMTWQQEVSEFSRGKYGSKD